MSMNNANFARISVCLSHVRKEISFDYSNFSRYTLSLYAIVMIERRNLSNTYSKCKTLCWEFVTSVNVCITLLCNISNKFFKTFSYNGNYYMQFYSVTQWLMYNDIASWVCNILFIMFNFAIIIHKQLWMAQFILHISHVHMMVQLIIHDWEKWEWLSWNYLILHELGQLLN